MGEKPSRGKGSLCAQDIGIHSLRAVLLCHSPCSAELGPVGEPGEYLCFLGCIAGEEGTVLSGRQRWGRYIYLFYWKGQCDISGFPHSLSAMGPM